MRHIASACGLQRKDVIASSAGAGMFGSAQTVQKLSASIRALHSVDSGNEST